MSPIRSRVRIEWNDGTPNVDQVMDTHEVHQFLLPMRSAAGYVWSGTGRGGQIDRFVDDGKLVRVGRYDVTDIQHVDYPHVPGYLYDCGGCEAGPCVCAGDASAAPCLSRDCERSE